MNGKDTANLVSLIAALLPVADQLYITLKNIEQNAPDAWQQANTQYLTGVNAWENATAPDSGAPIASIEKTASDFVAETETPKVYDGHNTREAQLAAALAAQAKGHRIGA